MPRIPYLKAVGAGRVGAEGVMANVAKKGVSLSHWFVTLPIVSGGLALLSQWDHRVELNRIKDEYRHEIAGRLGKRADKVTVHDMEKIAKESPVLREAVRRSTARRNVSVVATVAATAATLIAVPLVMHGLLLTGFAAIAVESVVGFLSFMGVERVFSKIGEKRLNLEEPDAKAALRSTALQGEMSVAGQITGLAHLQEKKKAISQEQVLTVLASANRTLAAQIESRFGAPFAKLSESNKRRALEQLGAEYNIAQLTADLNAHRIRAQELAFTAYGRTSAPSETNATQQRLAFRASQVSGAVPGYEPQQESKVWRSRIEAQRRQQAASPVLGA